MAIDKLNEMIESATNDQVPGLTNSIAQIDVQINELSEQQAAVRQMMDQCAAEVATYLEETKLLAFPGGVVSYGGNYNVLNITDFRISVTTPPAEPPEGEPEGEPTTEDVYVYGGVGWDADSYITQRISEWDFGYDYINRAIGTSGTYGLADMQAKLTDAKNLLNINLTKYTNSITIFSRFV